MKLTISCSSNIAINALRNHTPHHLNIYNLWHVH